MKKKDRILFFLSIGTLAALILAMMAATILEKLGGSPLAFSWVYHNPLFFALWAVLSVTGLCLVVPRTRRHWWTMLLHVAFVLILLGAFLSHLSAKAAWLAPWGLGVTYSAYGLLLLALIGFFFQKDTVFRKALSRVLQSSAFLLLFLLVPMRAEAALRMRPKCCRWPGFGAGSRQNPPRPGPLGIAKLAETTLLRVHFQLVLAQK